MATHSSVLAWKIPGMEEPSGLPSVGLHRVGHDWSDLAAAAAGAQNPQSHFVWIQRSSLGQCVLITSHTHTHFLSHTHTLTHGHVWAHTPLYAPIDRNETDPCLNILSEGSSKIVWAPTAPPVSPGWAGPGARAHQHNPGKHNSGFWKQTLLWAT